MDVNTGAEALLTLDADYNMCSKCNLCLNRRRNSPLTGSGSVSADIMVVVESPTGIDEQEDSFLHDDGGRLLLNMLEMVWPFDCKELDDIRSINNKDLYFEAVREYMLDRIFVTPVVACVPPDSRKPVKAEIDECVQRIHRQVYAVDPLIIIGLGSTAMKYVFNTGGKMVGMRGRTLDVGFMSPFSNREIRYACIPTYDPQTLLRIGDQWLVEDKKGYTYECMEDLKRALNILKLRQELKEIV